MDHHLTVRAAQHDGKPVLVVTLPIEHLTTTHAARLCRHEILGLDPTARIVIDLEHAPVIRSMIVSGIVTLWREASANGGCLCLCNVDPLVMDMLRVTRLDKLLAIAESRAAAIETVCGGAHG